MGFRSPRWLLVVLLLATSVGGGRAFAAEDPSALCERAIVEGARRSGVPQDVLHAISLTETGRQIDGRLRPWPWAINREGQGYWFRTRDEALAFAKASLADGRRSFDVSCFQINYLWHGANFASLEAMFDLDISADYAARFLQDLHAETGSWSAAAGAYHSRTPELAGIYRARFDRMLGEAGSAAPILASAAVLATPDEADPAPAAPRKSRMKMARGPLIIRVDRAGLQEGGSRPAAVQAQRLQKGVGSDRTIVNAAAGVRVWTAAAGHVAASGRGAEILR